jgi:hypothetical protein
MTDLDARAERVRAIAEGNSGTVIKRGGDIMEIEVPADIASGLASILGEDGISIIFVGQRKRLSHCRVIDMNGHTIVRHQMVTTAFYRYEIDLSVDTRTGGKPSAAAVVPTTSAIAPYPCVPD